jgi:hypothetical protein
MLQDSGTVRWCGDGRSVVSCDALRRYNGNGTSFRFRFVYAVCS